MIELQQIIQPWSKWAWGYTMQIQGNGASQAPRLPVLWVVYRIACVWCQHSGKTIRGLSLMPQQKCAHQFFSFLCCEGLRCRVPVTRRWVLFTVVVPYSHGICQYSSEYSAPRSQKQHIYSNILNCCTITPIFHLASHQIGLSRTGHSSSHCSANSYFVGSYLKVRDDMCNNDQYILLHTHVNWLLQESN